MHPITVDDIVDPVGRIKFVQDGRKRYIEFSMAKVIDVGAEGITVTPIGKRATFTCRPEDLELVEPANHDLDQTPASRESAGEQAEHNKGCSQRLSQRSRLAASFRLLAPLLSRARWPSRRSRRI